MLLLAACTSDNPLPDPHHYAATHAQNVRELTLDVLPPVRTLTQDEYRAEAAQNATQETDADIERTLLSYGRLGFYPPGFDLRGSAAARSDLYIAYYDGQTKSVTLVGNPKHPTIVHELVHALQDQHFDLSRIEPGDHISSDEALARSSLVEGDAVLAEFRDDVVDQGGDVIASIQPYVTLPFAEKVASDTFESTTLPKILASHAAFAYGFGTLYVTSQVGVTTFRYDLSQSNALFAAGARPHSTAEVMRVGLGGTAHDLEDTGLDVVPDFLGVDYEVDFVDRLGAWLTYVLFLPTTQQLPTPGAPAGVDYDFASRLTGDQFAFFRRKDGTASAITWTTIWDEESTAAAFEMLLPLLPQVDNEHVHTERHGRQVFFSKNLDEPTAARLAENAIYTSAERRLTAFRRPNVGSFPLTVSPQAGGLRGPAPPARE